MAVEKDLASISSLRSQFQPPQHLVQIVQANHLQYFRTTLADKRIEEGE